MNRMKKIVAGIGAAVLASCGLFGQTATAPPAFEVASVKPAAPQQPGRMMVAMGGDPGRVNYTNVSLKNVLMRAYDVKIYQITGPSWLDTERYDIVAKVPEGVPKEQIPAMLQALLSERFQMTIHRETKEQPVYALVVGKNGPKLKKYDESAAPVSAFGGRDGGPPPPPMLNGGAMPKGLMGFSVNANGAMNVHARGVTLSHLAGFLSDLTDRPVVDMTGIQGEYDITLEAAAGEMAGMRIAMGSPMLLPPADGSATPAPDSAPTASIFTAIQQLGLKLEPRRAPIAYLVVDKAEKVPTEN
jgi:uncharacterized protein (TIGR03435 family)